MKTKILSFLLAVAVLFCVAACNGSPEARASEETGAPVVAEISSPDASEQSNKEPEAEDEDTYYSNVVYYAGEDIPTGGYIVTCTGTEDRMDVMVFAGSEDFEGYQNADKFTRGEHRKAVELYAWADFELAQDESAYIGLRDGYIILLDSGRCEFTKYDLSSSPTVYAGIYVAGEDIAAEKIDIKCTGEDLEATLFENKDDYREYHKMDRYTRGEESDAVEKYAKTTDYISTDESTYVALVDGMVLMVENGPGEYTADEGPVING